MSPHAEPVQARHGGDAERCVSCAQALLLSVVIPVCDEAGAIPDLAAEIEAALAGAGIAWEALWIDDGSSDNSPALLRTLPSPHRFLALDRRHGQSAALAAGFASARGEWIATLDGDGQNDPADLPRLLAHARASGVDLVGGIRGCRRDAWPRRVSGAIANRVRNWATGERVSDVGCSTRVVRRAALQTIPFFHGMHRFLPTLVRMRGWRIDELEVNHRPRAAGRSKYGINQRLWSGLRDLLGVRWLLARNRVWRVVEEGSGGERSEPSSAHRVEAEEHAVHR